MKLRRRRRRTEIARSAVIPARPQPEPPLPLLSPPPSIIPLSSAQPHQSASSAAQLPLRHVPGKQYSPAAISSCSASPLLFHKITEATERGGRGAQPAGPAVLFNDSMRAPSSPHPCPSRWPVCPPPFSLSPVSRCGPSTSSEAIGKQRPKMKFPVSFPSLMNK